MNNVPQKCFLCGKEAGVSYYDKNSSSRPCIRVDCNEKCRSYYFVEWIKTYFEDKNTKYYQNRDKLSIMVRREWEKNRNNRVILDEKKMDALINEYDSIKAEQKHQELIIYLYKNRQNNPQIQISDSILWIAYAKDIDEFNRIVDYCIKEDWINKSNNNICLTHEGEIYAQSLIEQENRSPIGFIKKVISSQ